jgi:uncharacterized protein YbbC (DUF1343 family)/CubicO group peptidase (beta-lactamase class C family)
MKLHTVGTVCLAVSIVAATTHCAAAESKPGPAPKISWDAAKMNSSIAKRIDLGVVKSIDDGQMSGCVVLIGRRTGIVFEKAYGNRCVEPRKEPMTTDTLFDMASLTKPMATATAVMILIERGQLRLQDKVSKFFPEFATKGKQDVTIEQLLIHASGLLPDNPLSDYSDGWKSALPKVCNLKLLSEPGTTFKYSDVNFILLGKIVEAVAGEPENEFVKREVYEKLGMHDTGYLPSKELQDRAETTEKRNDKWLKGEVHDPRAAKMGGVAGHAGLFSTAEDMAIYATMMLQQGRYGGVRILSPATFEEMTRARDIDGHRRALGWDKQSGYSRNRGELMSDKAFGHGGFTGTSMWIDPELDLYVIFLGDRLHPDGVGEVNDLAGRIGTMACAATMQAAHTRTDPRRPPASDAGNTNIGTARGGNKPSLPAVSPGRLGPSFKGRGSVKLGIDVLEEDGFKLLEGKRVALITNQTGVDSKYVTTIERLHNAKNLKLVALFSPEHGIRGALDQAKIGDSIDEQTGIPVYSLYGENHKPSEEQLAKIDVLAFDIQDVGARFYTYPSTMCLALEAAGKASKEFVVLDRPNPIDGVTVEGPLLDEGRESFVGLQRLPIRHGLTVGEIATMFAKERKLEVKLTVVKMDGWQRGMYLFDTGLFWLNPSPNMRSLEAALLYPGVGMLEFTNLSVGRGTETPFEVLGAPWIDEQKLARAVNDSNPPGARVVPLRFTPTASKFAQEECHGIHFIITDWDKFRAFDLGLTVAHALVKLHHDQWQPERWKTLLGNEDVYRRVTAGEEVEPILKSIEADLAAYREREKEFELYP